MAQLRGALPSQGEHDLLIKSPFPPLLHSDREDFDKQEPKAAAAFSGLDFLAVSK